MIKRNRYLNQLIKKQWNKRIKIIKIITGIRRCVKSTLLFEIYKDYLISTDVCSDNIIEIALDDDINAKYRNPEDLSAYIREKCSDKNEKFYVFLDEIQFAISKEELCQKDEPVKIYSVLNGLLHLGKGNSEEEFMNILQKNMQPVYDSDRRQGYEIWKR